MTNFPPEEQAAYEAELRAQFEANDYEEIAFMVGNDEYTAVLSKIGTRIYDEMGDPLNWSSRIAIDDKETLKLITGAYLSGRHFGYQEGLEDGRDKLAAEIRKALGV